MNTYSTSPRTSQLHTYGFVAHPPPKASRPRLLPSASNYVNSVRLHDTPYNLLTPPHSYGWGTLIVAGGGAYYFAKKSINADRARKAEADYQKRLAQHQLEQASLHPPTSSSPTSYAPPSRTSQPPAPKSVVNEVGKLKRDRVGVDKDWDAQQDEASNPSREASKDPAPTRHAPEDEAQKMREKSKYEASDVYRSRKGDRFS
ncbi:hypothetical protein K458DRAFT_430957 [Lentithecium fluviatile CBS 122367]|uniref:Uncharacterized protein n=1 Tax=Lentithecium fluviatile CBS 122367 TaxID=1168545 RepID=A0A6G1J4L5_9PLEO|nr:hypothetical protein K458DRAFT_430957 [Lentithecium fluviatile CBS 122367]